MFNLIHRYANWLHTQWPAGTVEKLPIVNDDGSTNMSGLYIVGDLTGIPLLKFSSDTGARAVRTIVGDSSFKGRDTSDDRIVDLAIVGGGVSGFAAALEARAQGLRFVLYEATEPFSTIVNFPKAKPIYTYPTDMTPAGELQFHEESEVKEGLLDDLRRQTLDEGIEPVRVRVDHVERSGKHLNVILADGSGQLSHRVIVAIGRSGNFRKLGVPGEDKDKVYNRLHDPRDFCGQRALVVGGGDSALETAIALEQCGGDVTLSYRKPEFSRPKPENVEKIQRLAARPDEQVDVEHPSSERETTATGGYLGADRSPGGLRLLMSSEVTEIRDNSVSIELEDGSEEKLENDVIFAMIGREPPLDFFRKSNVRILGERTTWWWASLIVFLLFCVWMYHWKKTGVTIVGIPPFSWISGIGDWWAQHGWFPYNVPGWWESVGGAFANPENLLGTLTISLGEPGFYYSFLYCAAVVLFGVDRIVRKRTPYIKVQTLTLMTIQVIPLFILPYVLLPWMGNNGWFESGPLHAIANSLFPEVSYGHGREYWRAFGLILAWPLFFWNVFTSEPLWGWLIISVVQTFAIIPLIIWFFGKGGYCGWICSCGALAETLGDRHRHKMLHGPRWNRVNMIGQVFLLFALVLLGLRIIGWMMGDDSLPSRAFGYLMNDIPVLNYVWFVDLLWAGIIGVGLYFWFSGRVWCRFACPLAALMHLYARFSRFRIFADKKKCISCNVCTSVCHQGIDIMNFANKGLPMEDPECVRCSACVESCPTGVLSFGRFGRDGQLIYDRLAASPIQMAELTVNGRRRD